MSDVILKAENISKQYRLGLVGTGTVSHDLNRWWSRLRGKEDPYLKVGQSNDRSTKGESDYVWALKDINFEVKRGEVLGIIGKNGAGKSTLLKILSRVTIPTTGKIKTKGRIASLLEVGTGFHPEMTGRENIFLNGAILGMTKNEIASKLDEIIDFSGCARYIDTPVKRYSSGMRVRLAFAVAAHLEPDILVVDEVLAVGDAEFQKKAIGKMQDISTGQGRTVLFVSHNMAAVQNLCTRGIVLNNGLISYRGNVDDAILSYLKTGINNIKLSNIKNRKGNKVVVFDSVKVFGGKENVKPSVGAPLNLKFFLQNVNKLNSSEVRFDIRIDDNYGQKLLWMSSSLKTIDFKENVNSITLSIEKCPLNVGNYVSTIFMSTNNEEADLIENAFSFEVEDGDYFGIGKKVPLSQSKIISDFNITYA